MKRIAVILSTVLAGIFCVGVSASGTGEAAADIRGIEIIAPYAYASVFLRDNLWAVLVLALIVIAAIVVLVKRKKNKK